MKAAAFVIVENVAELREALQLEYPKKMILGGGSNLLFTDDYDGLIINNQIKGKSVERRFAHSVYVSAGAGENWHQFVLWCLDQGFGGIENLSLIPGTVGAAPIQNIGAYGVELKEVFHKLEAVDMKTGAMHIFRKADCKFGYRDSIFKRQLKGKFCITKVYFKLSLSPKINTSYGDISRTLQEMGVTKPSIKEVSKAVIQIRSSKLPDPAKLGNSGSFFKNPEVPAATFQRLQKQCPDMPHYPVSAKLEKIPAGWLIEQCGWKGKRIGNTGSHAQQALVLVNYGGATGQEIYQLAQDIIASVKARFGISLVPEVNLL